MRAIVTGLRECRDCGEAKPLDDFYFCGGRPQSYCRACSKARVKRWQSEHRDEHLQRRRDRWHANGDNNRAHQRKARKRPTYGLTRQQLTELVDAAAGRCQLCGEAETQITRSGAIRSLSVDHDHACCPGKKVCGRCVRGLLCNDCNSNLLSGLERKPALQNDVVRAYLARRPFQCEQ